MNLRCHCCHALIVKENPVHRGILVNDIASLGARIIALEDQVKVLRSKRWSKQFQKQHDLDIKRMVALLTQISDTKNKLQTLQAVNAELYHG